MAVAVGTFGSWAPPRKVAQKGAQSEPIDPLNSRLSANAVYNADSIKAVVEQHPSNIASVPALRAAAVSASS